MSRLFLLLVVYLSVPSVYALTLYIEGVPDYKVYQWPQGQDGPTEVEGLKADSFSRIVVKIPEGPMGGSDDGVIVELGPPGRKTIDLAATLEKWRKSSPVGNIHPRTQNGVGRFPIQIYPPREAQKVMQRLRTSTGENSSTNQISQNVLSISLAHLLARAQEIPGLRVSSSDGRPVQLAPGRKSLIDELKQIKKSGKYVDCRKPKNIDSDPVWTSAECMLCNCSNESLHSAPEADRLEIHKVVLRRLVSSNENVNQGVFYTHPSYPRSICGIILGKKQLADGSIGMQFSWTGGNRQTVFEMPARIDSTLSKVGTNVLPGHERILNECAETAIQALEEGPGRYDSYHNTSICPDWAKNESDTCDGKKIHLHRFYSLYDFTDGNKFLLDNEKATYGPIIRPLETDFWPEQEETHVNQ